MTDKRKALEIDIDEVVYRQLSQSIRSWEHVITAESEYLKAGDAVVKLPTDTYLNILKFAVKYYEKAQARPK